MPGLISRQQLLERLAADPAGGREQVELRRILTVRSSSISCRTATTPPPSPQRRARVAPTHCAPRTATCGTPAPRPGRRTPAPGTARSAARVRGIPSAASAYRESVASTQPPAAGSSAALELARPVRYRTFGRRVISAASAPARPSAPGHVGAGQRASGHGQTLRAAGRSARVPAAVHGDGLRGHVRVLGRWPRTSGPRPRPGGPCGRPGRCARAFPASGPRSACRSRSGRE